MSNTINIKRLSRSLDPLLRLGSVPRDFDDGGVDINIFFFGRFPDGFISGDCAGTGGISIPYTTRHAYVCSEATAEYKSFSRSRSIMTFKKRYC